MAATPAIAVTDVVAVPESEKSAEVTLPGNISFNNMYSMYVCMYAC